MKKQEKTKNSRIVLKRENKKQQKMRTNEWVKEGW